MTGEALDHYRELLDTHVELRGDTCASWTRIPDVAEVASRFGNLVEPVGRWTFSGAAEYRDRHDPSSGEEQDPIVRAGRTRPGLPGRVRGGAPALSPTFEQVTGRKGRTLAPWAADHAAELAPDA
ncbi:hypothetical protein ACFQQB_62805 [Nonomuraea rubra]|uniref:hypothetical protein n=1 Tax=Nonomuraea rubra TaxID=46180 RepID=UPI0036077A6C